MMSRLRDWIRGQESGQTIIFVAAIASTLMGFMGLAVLGGQVFVEYRHMQAAADMAALIGAQKLPCTTGDTSCYTGVQTLACNYAQQNGYGSGYVSGSACGSSTKSTGVGSSNITVNAYVPPNTCSPYAFVDYGNNSTCRGTTSTTQIYYDEVQIQEPMTLPIFNVTFTLSAHAVAKEGVASPTDFAVSVLNPGDSQALKMGNSGTVVVVGDTMANGGIAVAGGGGSQISCDGSWFTGYSQAVPGASSFFSNLSGQPYFADADCVGGSNLQPASFFPDSPLIPDPYGSTPTPTSSLLSSNCGECTRSQAIYYYWDCKTDLTTNRNSGKWTTATGQVKMTGQVCYEMWPGVYPGGIDDTAGATVFWNPGVYTMQGDLKTNGSAQQCIFGAPACDRLDSAANPYIPNTPAASGNVTCANATFQQSDANNIHYVAQEQWYYYCSPWGIYDTNPPNGTNGPPNPAPSKTPPTFYDPTGTTTYPMNGVTFYMQSGNFTMNGSGSIDVAFPNACPGTGTAAAVGTVPFQADPLGEPSGQADFGYSYPGTSLPGLEGTSISTQIAVGSYKTQVYPSGDLTLAGDEKCKNGLTTWKGEFPNKGSYGQHLQFVVFANNTSSSMTLNGNSEQLWWGILHTFPNGYAGYPGPPTGTGCGSCNITFTGSGGGGGAGNAVYGPPMLEGQVVTGSANFQGNSAVQVYYRPCRANSTPCGTGPGTGLVQ